MPQPFVGGGPPLDEVPELPDELFDPVPPLEEELCEPLPEPLPFPPELEVPPLEVVPPVPLPEPEPEPAAHAISARAAPAAAAVSDIFERAFMFAPSVFVTISRGLYAMQEGFSDSRSRSNSCFDRE